MKDFSDLWITLAPDLEAYRARVEALMGEAEAVMEDIKRAKIEIRVGETYRHVDEADAALAANAAHLKLFQRNGAVVRVVRRDDEDKSGGLTRPANTVQLNRVDMVGIQEDLERVADFSVTKTVKINGEDVDFPKPVFCPERVAKTYLARGACLLPYLSGIITCPLLRPDGSLLTRSGYDVATGLYALMDDDFPEVPDSPTLSDCQAALAELLYPFREFPFVEDGKRIANCPSRSVFLAHVFTSIERPVLGAGVPLIVYTAREVGTGKSKLADSPSLIVTGRAPSSVAWPSEPAEITKLMTSILFEGQQQVKLDNLTAPLDSRDLAIVLTEDIYQSRILGQTATAHLRTDCTTWCATGNNLHVVGDDMVRRTLTCRLDAQMEMPEQRTFEIVDLKDYLLANRKTLLTAALTILRGYYVAGQPDQHASVFGGFETWSHQIRDPLLWLGCADPCASRKVNRANDFRRQAALAVLENWREHFGEQTITVKQLAAAGAAVDSLRDALLAVARTKKDSTMIDPQSLGLWLNEIEGRIFDGMKICRADKKVHGAVCWQLTDERAAERAKAAASGNGQAGVREE